jgi:hypothetical protein
VHQCTNCPFHTRFEVLNMAKPGADYSMDNVSSLTPSDKPVGPEGAFPMGKGNTDMDGVESVEANSSLTYKSDQIFSENFGPPIEMDAVTELPNAKRIKPAYSGEGTGDVCDKPPGYDDF